jgi:uncharacterized protein (DUF1499 family)
VNLLPKNAYKKNLLQIFLILIITYILVIASIQIIAPDNIIKPENFPKSCPSESQNCTMIGPIPHRGGNISEIRFESNITNVMNEIEEWIEINSGEILQEWPNHTHAVFRTNFLRFPDDFVVNLHCDDEEVVIYVYSKSRLGISDLGVNNNRVESFRNYVLGADISTSKCTYGD